MEQTDYRKILNSAAIYLRGALSTMHLAEEHLVSSMEDPNPAQCKNLARLDHSFYILMRMASVLTDLEYLTGEKPIRLELADFGGLVAEVASSVRQIADSKNLKFHVQINPRRFPCLIDRYAIRSMMLHLISNAVKHTPAGGRITVDFHVRGNRMILTVGDSGCGMTDGELSAAMDGTYRLEESALMGGGMGLGLPLCRCIAEGHGGTLLAHSRPGSGTLVVVSLPATEEEMEDSMEEDEDMEDQMSSPAFGFDDGFDSALVGLADAVPSEAFRRGSKDGKLETTLPRNGKGEKRDGQDGQTPKSSAGN